MNILFYGNCQTFGLKNILNLSPRHFVKHHIECFSTNLSKEEYDNILKKCDVIITQPISKNYREKEYLSTEYLISNCKQNCKIIIFDSCYFNFYYFDLTYKVINNKIINTPHDYHYNNLIDCYNNNLYPQYYIDNFINNQDLKTANELEIIADSSLDELKKRFNENVECYKKYNIKVITSYDYIKNNYKNKLLFYSMNHPTKYVLQNIGEQIIKLLKIPNTINYNLNVLDGTKCIIYKCIQNVVNFNINDCEPLMNNKSSNEEIVKMYYESYNKNKIIFE